MEFNLKFCKSVKMQQVCKKIYTEQEVVRSVTL